MIRMSNLNKRYKQVQALADLNLEVAKGSVFGFIGPNGAGKTTAMSILATLLEPTSGEAYVGGIEVTRDPRSIRQLVGYMPDFFGVYDNLKAHEYLDFYARAFFIPAAKRKGLIADLLELVNLSDKADAYVDSLSRGMKQRLGLARSLVHNPEVLILDEPASGLDPRARVEIREIIKQLGTMGKTVLISSHILPELAEMCDTIGIIEKGRLIACGPVEEILARVNGGRVLRLEVLGDSGTVIPFLRSQAGVEKVEDKGHGRFQVIFAGDEGQRAGLLAALVKAGYPVSAFGPEANNLEDVFMEITGEVGE